MESDWSGICGYHLQQSAMHTNKKGCSVWWNRPPERNLLPIPVSSFHSTRWPQGIPFQLPDENQISSSKTFPDSRKNLIAWNGIDTFGAEFGKPALGNPYPLRVNVRVRDV
jgi:hypothetical protein